VRIGWIGLGGIGTEMVKRLLGGGYAVKVYERGQGLAELRNAGAPTSPNYAELAAESDLLILCVYSDAQLQEVLFDGGALAALRPGSIVAMHTTGSPELAQEIGARAPAGVSVLDATFSGAIPGVRAGTITIMAGGEADALDRARPALSTYASHIHHVGPLGNGQKVKLLNNLLLAANLMQAVEAMRIAEKWGLEAWQVAKVLETCSGASFALNFCKPDRPIDAALEGAWPYLVKDVAVVAETARRSGLDMTPFAPTVGFYKG
jgi:3-hydroxyisobutyrate dehydrogenase